MSLPVVTSVFSLSVKQEEDLPSLEPPESEIPPSVTGSPDVRPDILIRFQEEEFRSEPQRSEASGNLSSSGPSEDLLRAGSQGYSPDSNAVILKMGEPHVSDLLEGDNGLRNNNEMQSMYNGPQRSEWKPKIPFRCSPNFYADCEESISKVTSPRVEERIQNGEKHNSCTEQERYSKSCSKFVQFQSLNKRNSSFQNADAGEGFTSSLHIIENQEMIKCGNRCIQQYKKSEKNITWTGGERRFSRKSDLTALKKNCRPFKCNACGKCFIGRSRLRIHQILHRGEKHLKYVECEKSLSLNASYRTNKILHRGEKQFKSLDCCKTFSHKSVMRGHEKIHMGEKQFKCTVCDKCFSRLSTLRRHERIHQVEKPYKCSECGKSFSQKSAMTRHEMIHTGEKPFQCTVCNTNFSRMSTLRQHERIHNLEKPFKCSECDKAFSHKFAMRRHNKIHTGEKPFKCLVCDKCFSQRGNLRLHEMTHLGEKPFKCPECDKSFSHKSYLKNHERIHTGVKPFQCFECNKMFSQRSNLTKHGRIHTRP
ncbi:zinc finger protein OZF-like isoform X2 [Rhinatrema bivittatum]|uniref:zinc finger protein OZF-like isoform X2 n=1 Tax=Rhinatrema bivittatum TaxID=194408 RepID=UPI00112DC2BC|nr:zinc finger protein OZF-like isoform X2 [Rhinatrema bivittatum]